MYCENSGGSPCSNIVRHVSALSASVSLRPRFATETPTVEVSKRRVQLGPSIGSKTRTIPGLRPDQSWHRLWRACTAPRCRPPRFRSPPTGCSSTPDSPSSDATAIVDYLHALGISHCYASSYFKAVPGSTHGYDVADPTRLNPEIGDEAQPTAPGSRALRAHGMGHILDLVPEPHGHREVGEPVVAGRARERRRARATPTVFDIDWQPLKPELEHKVLLPVLGDIVRRRARAAGDHARVRRRRVPRRATTTRACRSRRAPTTGSSASAATQLLAATSATSSDEGIEFLSILTAIRHLPGRQVAGPPSCAPSAIAKRK